MSHKISQIRGICHGLSLIRSLYAFTALAGSIECRLFLVSKMLRVCLQSSTCGMPCMRVSQQMHKSVLSLFVSMEESFFPF